ncbi:MAG: DNA topoisomerase I [Verrucomicrobia bacterium]|nr:MAG: DNA topoisomerase I [Verrucomicrobiota bacterium]PYK34730.1 MAG: DNA topoisomerase I [Verrucomicrobiota bacterium]PYL18906.1 MAG: DNA topoisomerase I [Verrucomicrobiota bacterium]PYL80300.1 MAG: DNA topoisomerase I [Verrucomicrobiota bacterium]
MNGDQRSVCALLSESDHVNAFAKKRHGKRQISDTKIAADSLEAAEDAGLRYVSDDQPGSSRQRNGEEFEYLDQKGKPIRDEQRLLRIKRLAIPPAWSDVWICPSPNGHIQATGRDARRRKQYRYHERWREIRDENKYDRLVNFGKALPKIRRRLKKDLALSSLPREKVLATIVQLLERSLIRVGNEEYARENKSFGLTTMQDRHVDVKGSKLRFRFRGKSGRQHEVDVTDRRIARIVMKLQDLAGQSLFQYLDDEGNARDITSQDVNEYLREITGADFTAKDFRTWAGTVLAAVALGKLGASETKRQAKTNIKHAIGAVAEVLGNTPAICRQCYIHPAVLEAYLNGNSINGFKPNRREEFEKQGTDLASAQKAVLKFLQNYSSEKSG